MAQVTVEAEIVGHFSKGIRVKESGDYGLRLTVWTDERPPIGSTVKATGRLGAKTREHEGKWYVDLSVNFPTIEQGGQDGTKSAQTGAGASSGGYQASGVDNWEGEPTW